MPESKSHRIFYFDGLRAFAILCVVLLHVTGHLGEIMNYNALTIYSLSGAFEIFANNFFRIGISLFLMLSGALLLGRDWDIKSFFSKRIPRIAIPFIFWSFIFSLILISASFFIPNITFVTRFGIYDMCRVFIDTLLCRAPGSAVYWFFWMMLAMYLIMPIFNKWINKTDLVKVEYFLIIWVLYIILTYSLMVPIPEFVSFFISPLGFVVLGYYLRYSQRQIFNNSLVAIVFIVVPAVLMMYYSYSVVPSSILFVFHRYSVLIMMEAVGVFCLFKSSSLLNNPADLAGKITYSIAVCSYGMYLIHSQIIMIVRKVIPFSQNFAMTYIMLFIAGFIVSWMLIILLSRIPFIKYLIGVK